jgi:hypothetical protein
LTHKQALWSHDWRSLDSRLVEIETLLLSKGVAVKSGGVFDRWDLEVCGGLFGRIRALAMIEEHGAGKQVFRLRAWSRIVRPAVAFFLLLGLLAALATYDQSWPVAIILASAALGIALIVQAECAKAMRIWRDALIEYASAESAAELRSLSGSAETLSQSGTSRPAHACE